MRHHTIISVNGRLHRLLFVTVVAAALTGGCHVNQPYGPTPPTEAAQALEELRSLPSFEDTRAQVQAAMKEITAAAGELISGVVWENPHEGSGEGCQRRPYEQANARGYLLPDEVAVRVAVSERDWAGIQEAARIAAAKLDATELQVMQDQPGNHDVGFYGPAGLYIKVGYRGNLVVSGYTGCRLPREQK